MVSVVHSGTIYGIEPVPVRVEAHVSPGLPSFQIVGLAEGAVRESRLRVQNALRQSGFHLPKGKISVNLGPAEIPKAGTLLDLPIAVAILLASNQIPTAWTQDIAFVGELTLSGAVTGGRGILAITSLYESENWKKVVLPKAALEECSLLDSTRLVTIQSLAEWASSMSSGQFSSIHGEKEDERPGVKPIRYPSHFPVNFSAVHGQENAKRAVALAVVGQHNLLMSGPPGCGKSMIAERMRVLLPRLSREDALQVHILRGLNRQSDRSSDECLFLPPFRAPHHSATMASLVGGGTPLRPGEASLAHRGLLFLDELPEFQRSVLETLRQPLETGYLELSRVHQRIRLPADFLLVGAMNPCPCGYFGAPGGLCECPEETVRRYQAKISGPLLDRFDLFVPLGRISFDEVRGCTPGLSTEELLSSVSDARAFRRKRLEDYGRKSFVRAGESPERIEMSPEAQNLARRAMEKRKWSARRVAKLLRVARTIADFSRHVRVEVPDVAEAMAFRHRSFREASQGHS